MENCTKHYGVRLCNLHKLHRIGPDRQPSSRSPARQQDASQAAMLYTRLRGRAHPLRAALMFLRVCADAQVLRTRPRAMRVRKRESLVGL